MAIKGSLKEASLADVCQLLALGQKTGCLSVADGSNFGQIFFDQGRIVHARVVNRRDRLGDVLVRDRVISPEQLRRALDEQEREPGRRLGEILVERRLLEPAVLERYIRDQIEESIYHLFTWTQGNFYFEVGQTPEPGALRVSLNPEGILLEAARRVDEWGLIQKKIPSLDLLFEADPERVRAAGVQLSPEQERILPLLDGTRTVQELADATGLVEFDVGKALFGLIQAGFAHRVGARRPDPGGRVRESEVAERRNLGIAFYRTGMLEDATREFRRVLELRPGDPEAMFRLGLLALRQGQPAEAARRLRAVLDQTGPTYPALVNLAVALLALGRGPEALLALDEADHLRPGTARVALLRAALHLRAGRVDAATESLAEYQLRLRPGETAEPSYYHFAGVVAALAGRLDMAASTLDEALQSHPRSAPLLILAGAVAERTGDLTRAAELYRRAAEEDPSLPQTQKNLGDIAYRRGLYDEALEHYQRAVQLAPELGDDVYTKLGNLHYRRQDRDEAVRCWRQALERNPENPVVRNNLHMVLHAVR